MAQNLTDPVQFHHHITRWYAKHGRKDLPWQLNKTHYSVWLSEIMLQQTQVTTVIDYYTRFLTEFPSVHDLADAHQDKVMSLWAGLGYYARARNLHKTAQIVSRERNGEFPSDFDEMLTLPGIGRSTAAAVLSLTENRPFAILDGNVKRVLSRFYCEADKKELWDLAENLIQPTQASNYTQAMMDVGATICTRSKPKCLLCPLNKACQAYATNQTDKFPVRNKVKQKPTEIKDILMLVSNEKIFLEQRPNSGIWGGLWAMPLMDRAETKDLFTQFDAWPEATHIFTHFKLRYTPVLVNLTPQTNSFEGSWHNIDDALKLGIPKPVTKLLLELKEKNYANYSLCETE